MSKGNQYRGKGNHRGHDDSALGANSDRGQDAPRYSPGGARIVGNPRPQAQIAREDLVPCPLGGELMPRFNRWTNPDGSQEVRQNLVCREHFLAYREYQTAAANRARDEARAAVARLVKDGAPIPPARPILSLSEWVLGQIDLEAFEAELVSARNAYPAAHAAALKLLGDAVAEMRRLAGAAVSDPTVHSAIVESVHEKMAETGPRAIYRRLRQLEGLMEAAPRVKAELQAKLAKKAEAMAAQAVADQPTNAEGDAS